MSAAETAWPPPRVIHWRRAALVLTAVGCLCYFGSGQLFQADMENLPLTAMINAIMFGPILCTLLLALWYQFRGPGRWYARTGQLALAVAAAVGLVLAAHPSIRFFTVIWGLPAAVGATAGFAALLPAKIAPVALLFGGAVLYPWLTSRNEGVTGEFQLVKVPRWEKTAEERMADYKATQGVAAAAVVTVAPATAADWPGFRGAGRDGIAPPEAVAGWTGQQPRELWRHPVGPAWSSFVLVGDLAFTQEQRGESEALVCYRADTGKEVWAEQTKDRHHDDMAGPGPRATPTFADGKLYTIGGTSVLSCVNAADGKPVWSVKLVEALGVEKPVFGYAASPLVVGNLVVVNPSSKTGPRLAAFDAATGEKRWAVGEGGISYSSPQRAVIDGVEQVLTFDAAGFAGHDIATGKELWAVVWPMSDMEPASVQPRVLPDGRVVVGGGGIGAGTRCVRVKRDGDKWAVEDVWATKKFTPKFNDSVVVGDYLYGLDGSMACVNLKDGKRVWKDGRYGAGQLLLAGGKLLVISEEGKLACVEPSPTGWKELWRMDAIKGKTWNHMAVAHGRLLVRNAEEAAAFDLTPK